MVVTVEVAKQKPEPMSLVGQQLGLASLKRNVALCHETYPSPRPPREALNLFNALGWHIAIASLSQPQGLFRDKGAILQVRAEALVAERNE